MNLNDLGKLAAWNNDYTNAKLYFADAIQKIIAIDNYSNVNIDLSVYDYLYIIYGLFEDSDNANLLKKVYNVLGGGKNYQPPIYFLSIKFLVVFLSKRVDKFVGMWYNTSVTL